MSKNNSKQVTTENSLLSEASMASMALGIGLTHIRRYDFAQKGFFYSGMYSITTGLERLLKIIVIYNHRLLNSDNFPDNGQLRSYGHNLNELMELAVEINSDCGFEVDGGFIKEDEIYGKIIDNLSDFATKSRYYNLDYLTGRQQSNIEPLARWDAEIIPIILARHYKISDEKRSGLNYLGKLMEEASIIRHVSESGEVINSSNYFLRGNEVPVKQKYSMYYLFLIVMFLSEVCYELENKGRFYPCLYEFFDIFRLQMKARILKKKSWCPVFPYHF